MISVSEYPPSPALAPFVACYTFGVFNTVAAEEAVIEIVPNGCPEVIIHLEDRFCKLPFGMGVERTPDFMLIGLFSSRFRVQFNEPVPVFSIRLHPEALFTLFQLPGEKLIDGYENSDLIFGAGFRELCERIREEKCPTAMVALAEAYLAKCLHHPAAPTSYVARSAALMRHGPQHSIKEISEQVCISQRQLQRRFRREIGISPKQYLKLVRINRVIRTLENNPHLDLTSVAYHCGYYDQAHFIKDFKRITGQLPGDFRKGERGPVLRGA
ncbi:helix-turn-helix domain-containing protein [Neolewinella litorea]|uniref:AraC family transcriptional regulator n=1 Tax=Neolewinella litorea TaxID=2562452 RepID=A0A4S4NMP6_9BACT|nr:AraC family transcriptional regulator [Neolewinella litorea]THH41204.1 AraC family transcriptional regulator [Neolewinella litorea]